MKKTLGSFLSLMIGLSSAQAGTLAVTASETGQAGARAAVLEAGAISADRQTNPEAAAQNARFAGRQVAGAVDATHQSQVPTSGNFTISPPPSRQRPAVPQVTPDSHDDSAAKAAAEAKKKKDNMKKNALGGVFGGVAGLAFAWALGFGPLGIILGAVIGFGIMFGVTHVQNNGV